MVTHVYGTIAADGAIVYGEGFTCSRQGDGQYLIDFEPSFSSLPAIVGSQTGYGDLDENTQDNVIFPFLSTGSATALTGDKGGSATDRQFSFIAVGP